MLEYLKSLISLMKRMNDSVLYLERSNKLRINDMMLIYSIHSISGSLNSFGFISLIIFMPLKRKVLWNIMRKSKDSQS